MALFMKQAKEVDIIVTTALIREYRSMFLLDQRYNTDLESR